MRRISRVARIAWVAGALLGPVTASAALMRYDYTGMPFTTNSAPVTNFSNVSEPCDPLGAGPCDISNISARFIIEDLGANRAFAAITPLSWEISDGRSTVTDATPGWSFTFSLSVGTDATGTINEWLFSLFSDTAASAAVGEHQQIRTRDNSGNVDDQTGYCQANDGTNCTFSGVTRVETFAPNHVGNWNATAVPVPPAAWLLGSALLSLAGLRRKLQRR